MGTSQSSTGPGKGSPLIPPWADDQSDLPLPVPEPKRFKGFRQSLGKYISEDNKNDLNHALGHYSSTSTGGGSTAARRMGSVTKSGGALFGLLSEGSIKYNEQAIDLSDLDGQSCEIAISKITNVLTTKDGDSDKIRAAMNHALVEALDGLPTFDTSKITDDVIINIMIGYLTESIFLQIVMDGGKAWNKADNPDQIIKAEVELRELIKIAVDINLKSKIDRAINSFNRDEIIEIERNVIRDVWNEWEAYL